VRAERYFIDTNVPMYAAGAASEYKEPCVAVLEAAATGRIVAVTDAEVIQEIAYRYWHIGRLAEGLEVARDFAAVVAKTAEVGAEDALAMVEALAANPGLPPRDALHYVVMRRLGVAAIITADKHFRGLAGIVAVDPRDFRR